MSIVKTQLNLKEFIRADEMWYGIDRTEGGLGLKIPVNTAAVLQRAIEAQLILNIADDLIDWCRRNHRGERIVLDRDNLEIDRITAENPANAGVKIVDKLAATRDPYYIKIFLNKTFGINSINITWGMVSDESLLVHYMNDLRQRFGNGSQTEQGTKVDFNLRE